MIVTCALTVAGVTRQAIGESLQASARHDGSTVIEENAATSAEAQAFKRACSAFGLGRYLYSVPQVWAEYDPQRRQFTPAAVQALREMLRTGKYEPPAGHNGNRQWQAHGNGHTAAAPLATATAPRHHAPGLPEVRRSHVGQPRGQEEPQSARFQVQG